MSISWAAPPGEGVRRCARRGHAPEAVLVRSLQVEERRRPGRRRRVARGLRRGGGRRRGGARAHRRSGGQRRARPSEPPRQRRHADVPRGAGREIADEHEALEVELLDREAIEERGMGAFASVAQGSHVEPRLIVLRYRPSGATGPHLAFVGKAVTFDTGGISIKPSAKMQEMKFDMSGGAAVIEAMAAIAELGRVGHRHSCGAVHGEHAERPRREARRHRDRDERHDDRGEQHGRRGTPDPRRRALLRGRAGRRADRGPRDPHRRDPRGARPHLLRAVLERR